MAMAVRADAAVNAMLEADRLEYALQRARGFRTAEEQRATMLEREMQQRQHALLDVGLEANEQIAAGADIGAWGRRGARRRACGGPTHAPGVAFCAGGRPPFVSSRQV